MSIHFNKFIPNLILYLILSLVCVCSGVWIDCLQQRGSSFVTKLSNEL